MKFVRGQRRHGKCPDILKIVGLLFEPTGDDAVILRLQRSRMPMTKVAS